MGLEQRIKSWKDFLGIADRLDVGKPPSISYVFRGHGDAGWSLQPSLVRRLSARRVPEAGALKIEKMALSEFKAQAHHHVSASVQRATVDVFGWWTLMQHHGAPTRVLDWSASIFVAAYFASIELSDRDGAIWVVHASSVNQRMSAAPASGHEDLPTGVAALEKFLTQCGAPNHVYFAGMKTKTDRVIAQQGVFSFCRNILGDQENILANALAESEKLLIRKLVVPADLKPVMIRKLRAMNITASALFPGLDGLGRSIAELVMVATS